MLANKFFWRRIEHFTPHIFLVVVSLALLDLLLSFGLMGLTLSRRDTLAIEHKLDTPRLEVKQPFPDQKLFGQIPITLAYPEGFGFTRVRFLVDGQLTSELSPSPNPHQITFDFNTQKYKDGEHMLTFETTETGGSIEIAAIAVEII